jgi:diaminohydroxyphosphoribosylaminopyrimidine deaminase/5-amino-6-(5-phosphoribosylamino)uracil reductase
VVTAVREPADERFMRRALFHAARGRGRTTPNPMVGAAIVSPEGVVVGQGWHERAGEPHAEVHALEAAGPRAQGATLYVTLEPCCHTGLTGPCTERVIDAGIARVVAAIEDPDPRVSGKGVERLRSRGIAVDVGVCGVEAARLNEAFLTLKKCARPLVIAKAAASLDGRVAAAPGQRTAISSRQANVSSQLLRAGVDAIAVGSETVIVDDPLLTVRDCHRLRPLVRVVFDRRLRTPPTARLLSTLADGPVIIVGGQQSNGSDARAGRLADAGAQVVNAAGLSESLRALVRWDVSSVLLEGGPRLQSAFARAGLIDRLCLIVAPHTLGADGVPWLDHDVLPPSALSWRAAEPKGIDLWIEADVHGHC